MFFNCMIQYSEEELKEIRTLYGNRQSLTEQEKELLIRKRTSNPPSPMLEPLHFISVKNEDLFDKISKDPDVEKYSILGFLPEVREAIYNKNNALTYSFMSSNGHGARGLTLLLDLEDKKLVFKKEQMSSEPEIARIASDLSVGPKQYESLDGFILEEFVQGIPFPLFAKTMNQETSYNLGERVGEMLYALHSNDLVYNDIILTDDFWHKSHLIIPEDVKKSRLIDFGVTINLRSHPDLNKEEVFKYMRTLPGVSFMIEGNNLMPESESLQNDLLNFKQMLDSSKKSEIKNRDLDFISEGLHFASYNSGNNLQSFYDGFKKFVE